MITNQPLPHFFKNVFFFLLTVLLSFLLTGCDQNFISKFSNIDKISKDQAVRIEELEKKLDYQSGKITVLENAVKEISRKQLRFEFASNSYKSATFDPADNQGYQRVETSVGTLVLSVQDVKQHADGVKVRLHVGNLTTAMFKGGTFEAKWGPRMPNLNTEDFSKNYAEWEKLLQEKKSKFTEELKPGTWNVLTLNLPGIQSERFGYLEISIDTSQIYLLVSK